MNAAQTTRTVTWSGDCRGTFRLIEQTLLPVEFREIDCPDVEAVWDAIKMLRVRGAPAIGVAAAYGTVLGVQTALGGDRSAFDARLDEVTDYLATSRPTAVNLFWALERMKSVATAHGDLAPTDMAQRLLAEARAIEDEDLAMSAAMGRFGAELLEDGWGVLTHCNAGGLATAGGGTALAVFFAAAEAGKQIHVYADETRPLLQGARLTTWELMQREIPVTLICDSMAAQVMKEGRIQAVVTGADRIAANGDAANKIGTYSVALSAKAHGIPFYVAAPSSTFDLTLETGAGIPIEERDSAEVTDGFGSQTAPRGVSVYNPAFDVTPAELIAGIITEQGVIASVTTQNVRAMIAGDA
ncbi:MAG: S-methyl-5-thioribose-1-phosphate isomerase [Planctomycetaceae bacterium]|nr:S-methyl-5-thioribose-1-phosphate isomerase [Planctomycetaceae bacterium]